MDNNQNYPTDYDNSLSKQHHSPEHHASQNHANQQQTSQTNHENSHAPQVANHHPVNHQGHPYQDQAYAVNNTTNHHPNPQQHQPQQSTQQGDGLGIASMVLGIVSIVMFLLFFISIPCALIGLILGIVGRKGKNKGYWLSGIITSSIGLLISIAYLTLFIVAIISGSESVNQVNTNNSDTLLNWLSGSL